MRNIHERQFWGSQPCRQVVMFSLSALNIIKCHEWRSFYRLAVLQWTLLVICCRYVVHAICVVSWCNISNSCSQSLMLKQSVIETHIHISQIVCLTDFGVLFRVNCMLVTGEKYCKTFYTTLPLKKKTTLVMLFLKLSTSVSMLHTCCSSWLGREREGERCELKVEVNKFVHCHPCYGVTTDSWLLIQPQLGWCRYVSPELPAKVEQLGEMGRLIGTSWKAQSSHQAWQ